MEPGPGREHDRAKVSGKEWVQRVRFLGDEQAQDILRAELRTSLKNLILNLPENWETYTYIMVEKITSVMNSVCLKGEK